MYPTPTPAVHVGQQTGDVEIPGPSRRPPGRVLALSYPPPTTLRKLEAEIYRRLIVLFLRRPQSNGLAPAPASPAAADEVCAIS